MSFLVPQRNNEGVNSIAFSINIELGPNDRKVCAFSSSPDPKFHCIFGWRVDDELFVFMIVVSLSLKVLYIGAMKKFGKSKASDILIFCSSFEVFSMFFGPQINNGFHVQKKMHPVFDTQPHTIAHHSIADEIEFIRIC